MKKETQGLANGVFILSPEDRAIAERMKASREKKGIELEFLAAQAGIAAEELENYETAREPVPASVLFLVAGLMDMDPEELFDDPYGDKVAMQPAKNSSMDAFALLSKLMQ